MPTYTYRCQSCGVQFDRYQSFNDKPLTRCPECRKGKVQRVVQASAIVFRGSGWYKTDSRTNSTSTARKAEASGDSKAEAKTEGKAEPKAETKAEAKTATKTESKSESKPAVDS